MIILSSICIEEADIIALTPLFLCNAVQAGLLEHTPTIIITSTTGQGHFPSSILPLWNFLIRSDLPQDLLQDFHYALFGLGDSTYPKFNWPVRKLNRRLDMLGAREIIEKGEADDQHYLG